MWWCQSLAGLQAACLDVHSSDDPLHVALSLEAEGVEDILDEILLEAEELLIGLISSLAGSEAMLPIMRWKASIRCMIIVILPAAMEVRQVEKDTSSSNP